MNSRVKPFFSLFKKSLGKKTRKIKIPEKFEIPVNSSQFGSRLRKVLSVLSDVMAVTGLHTGQSGETWSWSLHSYRL